MTEETLEDRLARLAQAHTPAGIRRVEELAARPCCRCGVSPTRLYLAGRLCLSHAPAAQVVPTSPRVESPGRRAYPYGQATTDPLGRDAPEWRVSPQTRLPTRVTS